MMVMGCGDISSYSRRIKVNTRISTETELLSVDTYIPEVLWSLYFIQAQGYEVKYAEINQDNVSAQILETNGNSPARGRLITLRQNSSLSRIRSTDRRLKFWTAQRE